MLATAALEHICYYANNKDLRRLALKVPSPHTALQEQAPSTDKQAAAPQHDTLKASKSVRWTWQVHHVQLYPAPRQPWCIYLQPNEFIK